MKKYYAICIVALLGFIGNAQIVSIPDANFKAKLLAASDSNTIAQDSNFHYIKIDTNNDGEIQLSEALPVYTLNIGSSSISNLSGIVSFTNLCNLYSSYNQLSSLSLSGLVNLKYLDCRYNQMNTLNLTNLPQLNNLYCGSNNLTLLTLQSFPNLDLIDCSFNTNLSSLTISDTPLLTKLYCDSCNFSSININSLTSLQILSINSNHLSSLNLNGLVNLSSLVCANNQLTNLDVNNLISLTSISCAVNQLTSLNVSNLINLVTLYLNFNQVQTLDVSNLHNLKTLQCDSNNISSFYLKNGYNYTLGSGGAPNTYTLTGNPVAYVCADDNKVSDLISYFNSPTTVINSYCSFVPGGTYYTYQGNVRYDYNNNGCDALDISIPVANFLVANNTNVVAGFSYDMSGNYSMPLQAGSYTITPIVENPSFYTISPTSATISFPAATDPYTQDFCITPNGSHNDLEVALFPILRARPGFDTQYKIVYKNKGNTMQSGSVNLTFDDTVLDYVSAEPAVSSQATNSLSWSFSALQPFETRVILVALNVNAPTEIPAVNAGDVLSYTATINGATPEETPEDNSATSAQTVINSFDPNDKTCIEGTTITPSMVGNYVHYIVRFENDGTANAQNIVVKDMIDTTKFDINSLIPMSGSASYTTRITNTNQVEFIFQNINLPYTAGSNSGYVAFKIKTKPTLVVGDTFSNSANIYFDYNAPIATNTATTTIALLGTQDFDFGSYLKVYPVPAKQLLNLETKTSLQLKSIEIYNILGQLVIAIPNAASVSSIDVSDLKTGTYFIKVNTDKGMANMKFSKE